MLLLDLDGARAAAVAAEHAADKATAQAVDARAVSELATAIAVRTTLSFSLTSAIGNVRLHMRSQVVLLPLQFVLSPQSFQFAQSLQSRP